MAFCPTQKIEMSVARSPCPRRLQQALVRRLHASINKGIQSLHAVDACFLECENVMRACSLISVRQRRTQCSTEPFQNAHSDHPNPAGTGSRRVSIAPESSTENSWRESSHSHGSSMPQRSSSNLQPMQQARSRRGSRVSGEGAIPLQASGEEKAGLGPITCWGGG